MKALTWFKKWWWIFPAFLVVFLGPEVFFRVQAEQAIKKASEALESEKGHRDTKDAEIYLEDAKNSFKNQRYRSAEVEAWDAMYLIDRDDENQGVIWSFSLYFDSAKEVIFSYCSPVAKTGGFLKKKISSGFVLIRKSFSRGYNTIQKWILKKGLLLGDEPVGGYEHLHQGPKNAVSLRSLGSKNALAQQNVNKKNRPVQSVAILSAGNTAFGFPSTIVIFALVLSLGLCFLDYVMFVLLAGKSIRLLASKILVSGQSQVTSIAQQELDILCLKAWAFDKIKDKIVQTRRSRKKYNH